LIESKFARCEPDDPRRCQGVCQSGQCPYLAQEGTQFCAMHGAHSQRGSQERSSLRMYRLAKWQARVDEFGEHEQVKGLRSEIGILRMVLEELMTSLRDPMELVLYAPRISDIVLKIEKLVTSCHRLETSTGGLLDKSAVIQVAARIVEIVAGHVTDPDAMDAISNEVMIAVAQARSEEKK